MWRRSMSPVWFYRKNGGFSSLYRRTAAIPFVSVSRSAGLSWIHTPEPTVHGAGAHGGGVQGCRVAVKQSRATMIRKGLPKSAKCRWTCTWLMQLSWVEFAFFGTPYHPFDVCRLLVISVISYLMLATCFFFSLVFLSQFHQFHHLVSSSIF